MAVLLTTHRYKQPVRRKTSLGHKTPQVKMVENQHFISGHPHVCIWRSNCHCYYIPFQRVMQVSMKTGLTMTKQLPLVENQQADKHLEWVCELVKELQDSSFKFLHLVRKEQTKNALISPSHTYM